VASSRIPLEGSQMTFDSRLQQRQVLDCANNGQEYSLQRVSGVAMNYVARGTEAIMKVCVSVTNGRSRRQKQKRPMASHAGTGPCLLHHHLPAPSLTTTPHNSPSSAPKLHYCSSSRPVEAPTYQFCAQYTWRTIPHQTTSRGDFTTLPILSQHIELIEGRNSYQTHAQPIAASDQAITLPL